MIWRRGALLSALVLVGFGIARFDLGGLAEGFARVRPPLFSHRAFEFDPGFASFLEAVRARTPSAATIVIVGPKTELHIYQAAYQLAPRRVLDRQGLGRTGWIAVYGEAAADLPPGLAIPGGRLIGP